MKKLISGVLALVMVVTILQTSAFAVANNSNNCDLINQQIAVTGITFLYMSNDIYIYTHEKDGNTYKYIEVITSPNTIESEVYLLADGAYKLIDTITTVIEIPTVNVVPDMGEKLDYDMARAGYEYDWVYDHTSHGDTAIESKTVTAIAQALSILFGGPVGKFMGIAAIILDLGLDTVYYTIVVYKDRNDTSMLRPNFKWEIHLYSDAYRTEELDGSPIIKIIDE